MTKVAPPDFKALVEQGPGLCVILNPDFVITAVSDAYLRATMTRREDIVGRDIFDVFPDNPDDRTATGTRNLRASLKRVRSRRVTDTMAVQKYDIRKPASEGGGFEERFWSPRNCPVLAPDGTLSAIIHCVEDVTEFVRLRGLAQTPAAASEELLQANRFLESILENIPDMIFVKRADDLRFTRFNKAGEQLLGYRREDLLGKNDHDLFPKEQADFFARKDREVLEGRKLVEIAEEPIETRLKGRRFLHTKKIPILDSDGRPTHLLGISEDITLRRMTEEKLREAANMKTEFAAMVSHELRTPLTSIKMAIDLIVAGDGGPTTPEQAQMLAMAKGNVDRLARLINEVLDFQKLEAGRMEFVMRSYDLNSMVAGVMTLFAPAAREKGLELESRLSRHLPYVSCDEDKVTQVIVNLVNNAIKFSEKGRITVSTAADPAGVRVAVRDQGPGIRLQDQGKLFQSFVQLTGLARKSEGTGLGLAICRRIVESHGGRIGVDSAPGTGATFYFVLPAEPSHA